MSFTLIGIGILCISSIIYTKYTNKNIYYFILRLLGYSSVYISKILKFFERNDVKIKCLKIDNKILNETNIFKIKSFSVLQIDYFQSNKEFTVFYFNDEHIQFPLYEKNELEAKKNTFFNESSDNIIMVICKTDNKEIYLNQEQIEIIKRYSGPKGNFYSDKLNEYNIKVKKYILDELNHKDFKDYTIINILYSNGDNLEF